jgi:hypothetical protein
VVQTLNNLGALRLAGLAPEEGHDATYGLVLADGTEVEARLAGGPPTPGLTRWGLDPGRDEMGEGWSYALSEERRRARPRSPERPDGEDIQGEAEAGSDRTGTAEAWPSWRNHAVRKSALSGLDAAIGRRAWSR